MIENKVLSEIVFTIVLLVSIVSKHFSCEALALKSNANSLPMRLSYPKANLRDTVPRIDSRLSTALPPSILSDYYNSIIANSAQNFRRPLNVWPQPELIPLSSVINDEYEDIGDEYYNEDNTGDQLRAPASDIFYGNDIYQPEGWFNGPVVLDNSNTESNAQLDKTNDDQLNSLMLAYLLDRFDKLNELKELNEKRDNDMDSSITTTTQTSVPSTTPKVTTHAIPKKLTATQFRLFQRGQKEVPLLRPAAENEKRSEWPQELEESNLSQEESLMSLKQQKGQLRTVRDVLTAQLDSLKKEGPKMH